MHIKKCVYSLLSQTLDNIEVLAINDGSSDKSLEILRKISIKDSRLRVFSQDNSGPSTARNVGLRQVLGKYVAFLDADDWLETNALERLKEHLHKNNQPDIVMFNNFINLKKKNKPFLTTGIYSKLEMMTHIYPRLIESLNKDKGSALRSSVWLRIFKSDLIIDKVWFKENLINNEDLVFCLEATLRAKSFSYLGEHYLHHNCLTRDSISRGYVKNSFKKMKPLFNILTCIDSECDDFDFLPQIKARVLRTVIFCFENEFHKNNLKSFIKKYKYLNSIMNDKQVRLYLKGVSVGREKSKVLYVFLLKYKFTLPMMFFAKYRSFKQQKRVAYV